MSALPFDGQFFPQQADESWQKKNSKDTIWHLKSFTELEMNKTKI